jgi:hypothetical protein
VTCSERVGGSLAAVVHGRGRGLTWETHEVQGCWCVRSFGQRGRGEGWSSRWPASVLRQSKGDGGSWVSPKRLAGGAAWPVGCTYPPGEWRRGERGVGGDLGKILRMHGSGLPLSFFSFKLLSNAKAGVVLGAMLVIWLGFGARF